MKARRRAIARSIESEQGACQRGAKRSIDRDERWGAQNARGIHGRFTYVFRGDQDAPASARGSWKLSLCLRSVQQDASGVSRQDVCTKRAASAGYAYQRGKGREDEEGGDDADDAEA